MAHPLQMYGTMIAIMLALIIFLIRVTLYAHPDGIDELDEGEDPRRTFAPALVIGFACLVAGVICYFGDSAVPDAYSIFHGWWHILGGIGVGLVAIGAELVQWRKSLREMKLWVTREPEPVIQLRSRTSLR